MKNIIAFSCVLWTLPSLVAASGIDATGAINTDPEVGRGASNVTFFEVGGEGCPCVSGAPEFEPGCGIPEDNTNGGCNSDPVVTSPLALNETVCGTAGYDGVYRDTDWYEIVITDAGTYTWNVAAEFPAAIFILDTACSPAQLAFDTSAGCGDVATASLPLTPGTYRFFVAPEFATAFACGRDYTARLTGPPAGDWTASSPFGLDTFGTAAASDDRHVYAGGGFSFTTGTDTTLFARWDPVTGAWTPRAPLPIAINDASLVYGRNGKMYLFGGIQNPTSTVSNLTFVYDIALNSWSPGPDMPAARQQMASGYHANWIYLAGGYPDGTVSTPNPALWAFNVPSGTWNTLLDPVPAAFGGAGGAVIDGKFLVAGGRDLGDPDRDTLFVYDIAGGGWTSGPNLPVGTNVPGSAATEDGELWIYGGGNPFLQDPDDAPRVPETTGDCQRYSALGGWSACPSLVGARSFTASAEIGGRLIAIGGYTGATTTPTSEVFIVSAIFLDGFESGYTDEWTASGP